MFSSAATFVDFTNNAFLDTGSAWQRVSTGNAAARFRVSGAGFTWFQVASGSNPISWTQAMTLDVSGRLLVGPTSANASGGILQLSSGITFPATQVASSDANTLDDYEEGTFTPTIVGTTIAGVGVYSDQSGFYTKIGNLVTVQIYLNWTSHTGTGNMRISGLPFSSTQLSGCTLGYVNSVALTAGYILNGFTTSTQINLQQTPSGGGGSIEVPLDVSAAIIITVSYRV
jgi:hypothetical protein